MPDSLPQASELRRSTIGFLNGQWVDKEEMSISISDLGFRQAVTAVERLRTYQRKIFQIDAHLHRWRHTTAELAIDGLPPAEQIRKWLEELLQRNRSTLDQWPETGITMLATPGSTETTQPTFALHLNALDLKRSHRRQRFGQPLVVTDIRQPPSESWPRSIKVRCRLHYYLADQKAGSCFPEALGVLVDNDQSITETSVANIAIVESGGIVSPLPKQILGGITQSVVERIAEANHVCWNKALISSDRLQHADEVLLMGTDTGIWFANRVNDRLINQGKPGKVYQDLLVAFDRLTSNS